MAATARLELPRLLAPINIKVLLCVCVCARARACVCVCVRVCLRVCGVVVRVVCTKYIVLCVRAWEWVHARRRAGRHVRALVVAAELLVYLTCVCGPLSADSAHIAATPAQHS